MNKTLPFPVTKKEKKVLIIDYGVGKGGVVVEYHSTQVPTLRCYDLVFGSELGKGASGIVKYARRIIRNESRSKWPEYTVKVRSIFFGGIFFLRCMVFVVYVFFWQKRLFWGNS